MQPLPSLLSNLSPQQAPEAAQVVATSFAITDALAAQWLERGGLDEVRLVRAANQTASLLLRMPMGQWWGGRSVSNLGISAVATAPERRGQGLGQQLMRSVLQEAHAEKFGISTLYPATLGFYRKFGYEVAGFCCSASLRALDLRIPRNELSMRKLSQADLPAAQALYERWARLFDGPLKRSDTIWARVTAPRFERADGYGAFVGDTLLGYLYLRQTPGAGGKYALNLTDFVAPDPRAARRLLAFLADHRSLADTVSLPCGPNAPLLSLLPENLFSVTHQTQWMLRLLHLPTAFGERGYPPVRAQLELELEDALIEANRGRFTLTVEDGIGQLTEGGAGALKTDARGLAALYSGYHSPAVLARMGWLSAPPRALQSAALLFGGSVPFMVHMF